MDPPPLFLFLFFFKGCSFKKCPMLSDNLTSSIGLKAALVSFLKKVLRNSRLLDLSVTFFTLSKAPAVLFTPP